MKNDALHPDLQRIRRLVEDETGLEFPPSRSRDLQRGISAAAKELGFHSAAEYAARLVSGPSAGKALESLINNLTVGETYFFRETRAFDLLADQILPALIRSRRNGGRHLRIWSAACCTGEEAYSIAILLRRTIPDWEDWNITLLATDINSRFLRKAVAGKFGQWSFRDAPSWLRPGYFRPTDNGLFEIVPEIRQIVRFARLNLADDTNSSPESDTGAMDVIFCRNVLMYFSEAQARKVIRRLYRNQSDGGWLIVGASELPSISCAPYVGGHCHGAVFYQKRGAATPVDPMPPKMLEDPTVVELELPAQRPARPPQPTEDILARSSSPGELAAACADQGRLSEALDHCDRWIAVDKLNASSHYLRGVILQEAGNLDEAVRSLRTALYLDPHCAAAHFALGNIARNQGACGEAARHLRNARKLLGGFHSDDPLPDFGGVTAGRFREIVDSLMEMEAVA